MLQNSVERCRLIDKNKMYPKNESLKYDIAMSTLVVYAVQTPPPLIRHARACHLLPRSGRRHSSPCGEQSILPRRLTPPFFFEKPSDSTE